MMTVDPQSRFTMNDIISHPWFHVDEELEDFEPFRDLVDQIESW
jgi:hypothetical protein